MPPLMTQELIKVMESKAKNYRNFAEKVGISTKSGVMYTSLALELEHWLSKIQKLSK